jgi:glutaminyl-tRNA synthetase
METDVTETARGRDFISQIVADEVAAGKNGGRVQTRFPPEPNGYLHIGHAKAICVDFGVAQEYGGTCYLRFDDTNPERETEEFVESIKRDVHWLGFDWGDRLRHASDYFTEIHDCAVELIKRGLAYVDHQNADDIRKNRGTLTEPGKNSPYRDRSPEENLRLFDAMKRGDVDEGVCVLRAKIDMASPNINLRDPTLYRVRKVAHQRTGSQWCIYPMYDYAHTLSDAIEGTTHSLCTLEFEDHRPLYDWFLDQLWQGRPSRPRQIEFSRANLMFTVTSKRKLKQLVEDKHVDGWDDPRMPTLAGIRRRGYTPESIVEFVRRIGTTKKEKVAELGQLEGCVREDLNERAPRRFAVLDPLKIVIETYPEGKEEWLEAANHPNKPELGVRKVPFSREILIEREDFMENAPSKFHRLKPGGEVRLRYGYIIKCERVVKDSAGNVTELHCSHDAASRSGSDESGRKVKGTIHWVSAKHARRAPVRLYDRLFSVPFPGDNVAKELNAASLKIVTSAVLEPALADAAAEERFQFERLGYFIADRVLSKPGAPVFNRTVTLRDSWAKLEQEALAKLPRNDDQ